MAAVQALVADRGDASRRVDLMLRRRLGALTAASRTRVQGWIAEGLVVVNGRQIWRSSARVAFGDVVEVAIPERARRRVPGPEAAALDVLYEDAHLLVVNKPAGLVAHPTYGHPTGTLLNALLWHARDWPPGQRPTIVGRLDRLTSGVTIVARTRAVHSGLQRAMSSACKHYLAIVYGTVSARKGRIEVPVRRDPSDRRRVIASPGNGLPSATAFERLACADAPPVGLSLLNCQLMTGRMHQIRVHLASRGWPIVGDAIYGAPRWREMREPTVIEVIRTLSRQALHARAIVIRHPVTGAVLRVEAPLPDDLLALMTSCGLSAHECSAPLPEFRRLGPKTT